MAVLCDGLDCVHNSAISCGVRQSVAKTSCGPSGCSYGAWLVRVVGDMSKLLNVLRK